MKTFLTTTMALAFVVMVGDMQPAQANCGAAASRQSNWAGSYGYRNWGGSGHHNYGNVGCGTRSSCCGSTYDYYGN